MLNSPRRSAFLSGLLHAAAIALVLLVTGVKTIPPSAPHFTLIVPSDIGAFRPTVPKKGGGGGGVRDPRPATVGKAPRFALRQFTAPVAVVINFTPVLPMEPTLIGDPHIVLPTLNLAQYGDPNGVHGPPSGGPGSGGGIGDGDGTGIGPRRGPGLGPGEGDTGISGSSGPQGATTLPIALSSPEPEYSEEARKVKLKGAVVISIEVDVHRHVQNIKVVKSLGLGLDERAIETVKTWKFRPGTRNGKPVVTPATVEVNFRLL